MIIKSIVFNLIMFFGIVYLFFTAFRFWIGLFIFIKEKINWKQSSKVSYYQILFSVFEALLVTFTLFILTIHYYLL